MTERYNRPREMAKRWYADMGVTMSTGYGIGNWFSGIFEMPPNPSTGSIVAGIVAGAGMLATQNMVNRHTNRQVEQVNPSEHTRKFIRKQMNRLFDARLLAAGTGASAGVAYENIIEHPFVGGAIIGGSYVLFKKTENKYSEIGSRVNQALDEPFKEPPSGPEGGLNVRV